MKIIGINGSPRAKGNTRLALDTMGEVFAQEGVEFDILHIGHKLSPCSGCFRCAKTHTCTLPDDGLNAMYDQLIQADGIVLASPVYFASVTSGMRCFLDRIGCELFHYLNYAQMLIPGSLYWPLAFGQAPGEVAQDAEGIQTLQVLAQEMVYVMKVLDAGKAQVPLPPLPRKVYTNFVR